MNPASSHAVPLEATSVGGARNLRPGVPFALGIAGLLAGFLALPRIHDHAGLVLAFAGGAILLATWAVVLALIVRRTGRRLWVELVPPLKSHYVQASVQVCVYAYWGWYWREVYSAAPLILGQLVFYYGFEALLTWSRGRTWRLGCGALPVILSTNVFIWFKDDWYALQFALVAAAALGKEFVRWQRDGRSTHVFNPSALAMSLFAVGLLATGTTHDLTWAGRMASTIGNPPHMYLLIFLLGLVVQHFFSITLMTFSAVLVLCALNLGHTWWTGTYYFVFSNLPVPVFLGLHLLVTDPSTSPRTNAGKAVFGALYGLLAFVFYGLLERFAGPTVYDKLLPVPLLNLGVLWIDRAARSGVLGRFTRWEARFRPRVLNAVHMGCWGGVFALMMSTGYVGRQHEGGTYEFWRKAVEAGRPGAEAGLLEVLKSMARDGSSSAWNELGLMYLQGQSVEPDRRKAVQYFARSSQLGNLAGSANLVQQFLSTPTPVVPNAVVEAIKKLELDVQAGGDGSYAYILGLLWETGTVYPRDPAKAKLLYAMGCQRGSPPACAGFKRLGGTPGAQSPR